MKEYARIAIGFMVLCLMIPYLWWKWEDQEDGNCEYCKTK